MTSGKYYVVFEGRRRGVYDSWAECQREVSGYNHALYKKFRTQSEAFDAFDRYVRGFNNPALHEYDINEVEADNIHHDRGNNNHSRCALMFVVLLAILVGYVLGLLTCASK